MMLIFSIQGMMLFKGKFYYCDYSNLPEEVHDMILTKWDCMDFGGNWVNRDQNYDNIGNSMLTTLVLLTAEGWREILHHAIDSTKVHNVPQLNTNQGVVIIFVVQLVITSLFILNLFVGVVINSFNTQKEKLSHNSMLTATQTEICDI